MVGIWIFFSLHFSVFSECLNNELKLCSKWRRDYKLLRNTTIRTLKEFKKIMLNYEPTTAPPPQLLTISIHF